MKLKTRHKRRLALGLKATVIVLGLFALAFTGASTTARAFADQHRPTKSKRSDAPTLVTDISSDEAGGEMAPGSGPTTEQAGVFSIPILVKTLEQSSQDENRQESVSAAEPGLTHRATTGHPVGSTCLVSPSLGRQFTLIGAKPSGTG
jgi:hypothetical protein